MTREELLRLIAERVKDKRTAKEMREIAGHLTIDETNLNGEMAQQSGLFAYTAVGHEYWEAEAEGIRFQRKVMAAGLGKKIRSRVPAKGVKPPTEAAVEAEVTLDAGFRKLRERELEARAVAGIFKALTQSLRDRKDMLVSIGANQRAQLQAEGLSISEATVQHEVSKTRRRKPRLSGAD